MTKDGTIVLFHIPYNIGDGNILWRPTVLSPPLRFFLFFQTYIEEFSTSNFTVVPKDGMIVLFHIPYKIGDGNIL